MPRKPSKSATSFQLPIADRGFLHVVDGAKPLSWDDAPHTSMELVRDVTRKHPDLSMNQKSVIWLFAHNEEFFMSYEDFPWFKKQSIEAVLNVEELSPAHYYWPAIDVDLTKEIIKNPDRFPLKAKVS